jgi:hypothetical protein
MKHLTKRLACVLTFAAGLTLASSASAETIVNTFDYFSSGALYASWSTATIDSGETAYTITATGYGSNWKYNPIDATGETTVQLTVTLNSAGVNDGKLGPIVTFVDADGTKWHYAWYGQTNGHHVLTMPLSEPTWKEIAGSVSGLDLATLTHLHMQLDPSSYSGLYTIAWEDLRLTGAPGPTITAQSFNPATREFTLTWTSKPNKVYSVLHAAKLTETFTPLVTDIWAVDTSTSTTVTLPSVEAGFVRIQQQ